MASKKEKDYVAAAAIVAAKFKVIPAGFTAEVLAEFAQVEAVREAFVEFFRATAGAGGGFDADRFRNACGAASGRTVSK